MGRGQRCPGFRHSWGLVFASVRCPSSTATWLARASRVVRSSVRNSPRAAENTQISLTDPSTNELIVTPKKVAGLSQISNEAASDSNPTVADQIGKGLARSIAKKVDAAFFGDTVTNGPSGLLSLVGVNVVDTGTVLVSTDVAAGNAWGLDGSQVMVVQRTGTQITRSADAAFGYDAVQVRGTARVGFGFANPAGIVRLYDAA
jgi:Phage capsid family